VEVEHLRILLTNDDGITAPGIQALWRELSQLGEVTVVAPDTERSATSQAITVHHPIRVDQFCIEDPPLCAWRVGGTPTDCVKIALETLLEDKPDVVVSGINQGPNLGTDVLYSGTVSAAIEGALHGFPAIAVSLATWQPSDFGPAARFTARLVQNMAGRKLPANTLLNVNVPALPEDELGGVEITKLGVIQYENAFERRQDPRGRTYYWMGGSLVDAGNEEGTDVVAIKKKKISVTPIHFDLTNYAIMHLLEEWNL
jgi:5'-nucleotidase